MVETVATTIGETWGDQSGNQLAHIGFKNPRGEKLTYVFAFDTAGNLEMHERSSGGTWSLKSTLANSIGSNWMLDCCLFEDPTNSQLVIFLLFSEDTATGTGLLRMKRLRIADSNSALSEGGSHTIDSGGSGSEATRATCAMVQGDYLVVAYIQNNKAKGNNFYDVVVQGTTTSGTNIPDAPSWIGPTLVTGMDPSTGANSNNQDKTGAHCRVAGWPSGTNDGIIFAMSGDDSTTSTNYDHGAQEFTFNGTSFTFATHRVASSAAGPSYQINGVVDRETTPNAHIFEYVPNSTGIDVRHWKKTNGAAFGSASTVIDTGVETDVDYATVAVDTSASPDELYFMWEEGTGTWEKKTTPVDTISWSSASTLFTDSNNAVAPISAWHQDVEGSLHVFYRIATTTLKYHDESVGGATQKTVTTSLNAALQDEFTKAANLNSAIKDQFLLTTALNAGLAKETLLTNNLDSAIEKIFTLQANLESAIEKLDNLLTTNLNAGVSDEFTTQTDLNAVIVLLKTLTLTLDSVIQATIEKQTNLDGAVKLEILISSSLNALISLTKTLSASLNSVVEKLQTQTTSLNAAISQLQSLTANLDAGITKEFTKQASLDAVAQIEQLVTTSLNASIIIVGGATITTNLNAAIEKLITAQTSLSGVISDTFILNTSLNAALAAQQTNQTSINAAIEITQTVTTSLNAAIEILGLTKTANLTAVLSATQTVTANLQAAVAKPATVTTNLESAIAKIFTVTSSLDASLTGPVLMTANLNAAIGKFMSIQTSLDAGVSSLKTTTTSLDSAISDLQLINLDLDAVLQFSNQLNVLMSSAIIDTFISQISIDAAVEKELTLQSGLNAGLAFINQLTATLSAVISGAQFLVISMDSVIEGSVSITALLDAILGESVTVDPTRIFRVENRGRIFNALRN